MAALPALSCIDDLAGETVLTACEKALFGSAETAAAALSYAASQITRLTSFGDVATADKNLTPELQTLRRAVERDRYGLMAHVLLARDHCTPSDCAAFRSLTDRHQIVANMEERIYDGLIMRYSRVVERARGAPQPAPAAASAVDARRASPPMRIFPTAASTPPVNIMTPEPATAPPASVAPAGMRPSARPPAAVTAPDGDDSRGAGGGQEAAAAQAAPRGAGPACAARLARRPLPRRRLERLMLSKAGAGR